MARTMGHVGSDEVSDLATSDRAYLACLNVPDRSITTFPAVIPTSAPRRPGQMRTCGRLLRKDSPSGHPSSPNGSLMQRSGSRPGSGVSYLAALRTASLGATNGTPTNRVGSRAAVMFSGCDGAG